MFNQFFLGLVYKMYVRILSIAPPIVYIPLIILSSIFNGGNQTIFSPINFTFVNIGIYHTSWLISNLKSDCTYNPYAVLVNFLFLHEWETRLLIQNILYLIVSVIYKLVLFNRYLCNDCIIITQIFESLSILAGISICMQITLLGFHLYTFYTKRHIIWQYIAEREKILNCDRELCKIFECTDDNLFVSKEFLTRWRGKSTLNIKDDIRSRIIAIFEFFGYILNISERKSVYSYDDYVIISNVIANKNDKKCNACNHNALWKILSDGKEISQSSLEVLFTKLDKKRRTFANMLYTDSIIAKWIVLYFALFFYGLGIVFIIHIFGYAQAFGSGIDLLKIYFLIAAYLIGIFKDQLSFLIIMVKERPFNIGDMLLYNDDFIRVCSIGGTSTSYYGTSTLFIKNANMLNNGIINVSKKRYNDSFSIDVPIIYVNALDDVKEALISYGEDNRMINIESIRIESSKILANTLTINCHWQYVDKIYDRSSFVKLRTNIYNFVYSQLKDNISHYWMLSMASSGGAFNNKIDNEIYDIRKKKV